MLAAQGFISAAGVQLEYRWIPPRDPQPQQPTLVFLHEGLGCVALWRDFPNHLCAATGLGGLIYSRAGYGQSDPVELPRPVTYMHYEAQIVLPQVLAAADIDHAILVGHSDGASIAIIYAGNNATVQLQSLILLAPHVFNEPLCSHAIQQTGARFRNTDLAKRLARYHQHVDIAFWGWHDAWIHSAFKQWNIEEFLPNIDTPLLLIQGLNDEYGSQTQLTAIEQQVKGPVRRLLLANCHHAPQYEQTQATLAAATAFISDFATASC